jgi:CarboxypepD_reg-like domain
LKTAYHTSNVKRTGPKISLTILISALLWLVGVCPVQAQQSRRVIQLSGIVLGKDSVSGIPGVNVYVPKAGRGTTSNSYGFFSLPVLVGDSIIVSSIGYERQYFIVPDHPGEYLTIVFELHEDVTYLREIEITPFPTEEVFKEAVLALNLPLEDQTLDKKNLDAQLLALILRNTPMDGYQNQRLSLDQWAQQQSGRYGPVTNPLFNPFNWAKFIQSRKKKEEK